MELSRRLTVVTITCLGLLFLLVTNWGQGGQIRPGGELYYNASDSASRSARRQTPSPYLPEAPRNDPDLARVLWHYLENPEATCRELKQFGGIKWSSGNHAIDGDKFVCLDPAHAPDPARCLVYSVGINNEWSFDRAMLDYGCEVHAFDPSMTQFPEGRTPFGAWFHRLGLAGWSGRSWRGWQMRTLTDLRRQLGHANRTIDYLKVDIEGDEWAWLESDIGSLQHVRQFGMEVHMSMGASSLRGYYALFSSINQAGFKTVHSNINRVNGRRKQVPGVKGMVSNLYELVWVRSV